MVECRGEAYDSHGTGRKGQARLRAEPIEKRQRLDSRHSDGCRRLCCMNGSGTQAQHSQQAIQAVQAQAIGDPALVDQRSCTRETKTPPPHRQSPWPVKKKAALPVAFIFFFGHFSNKWSRSRIPVVVPDPIVVVGLASWPTATS